MSLSQGTTLSYASASYSVTRISVNANSGAGQNRQRISTATLASDPDLAEPYVEIWQPRADEAGGNTVDIDFLGASPPGVGSTGSLVIGGAISLNKTAVTVVSSVVTAAVGDLVRGSASFKY